MDTCTFREAAEMLIDNLMAVNDNGFTLAERSHAKQDLERIAGAIQAALNGDIEKVAEFMRH